MADSENIQVETITDVPSTRGIRDWLSGTFASYDSITLPNGIKFGYEDNKYGYYDDSGMFHKM